MQVCPKCGSDDIMPATFHNAAYGTSLIFCAECNDALMPKEKLVDLFKYHIKNAIKIGEHKQEKKYSSILGAS